MSNKFIFEKVRLSKVKVGLVSIWFLLLTLNSFYFYQLGAAIPPVTASLLSWVFLIFILNKSQIQSTIYYARYFLIASLFLFLFSLIVGFVKHIEMFNLRTMVFYLLGIGLGVFSCYLFLYERKVLAKAVKVVLIFHLVAFFIQVSFFYLGIATVDYLEPFTGERQRFLGGSYYLGSFRLFRGTGLYNEPGTFSTFILIVYIFKNILENDRFKTINIGVLDIFVFLSIAFSFSTLGFVLLFLYFLIFFLRGNVVKTIVLLPAIFSISLLAWNFYFEPRFINSTGENAIDYRKSAIQEYFQAVAHDPTIFLFGYGGFTDRSSGGLFEKSYSWGDMSLFLNFPMVFGFFGLVFITLLLFSKKMTFSVFVLLFLFGFTKIHPGIMFFWLIFSFLLFDGTDRVSESYLKRRV